ncbi:hypothetical protein FRC14_007746 [Serendipita sp. 396]|nr:hypothetical protein FRC14_007746 [Serendipita sp. 396]
MLEYALLWLFHLILALKRFFATLLPAKSPQPLRARRKKLPNHLAVLLSSEGNVGNGVEDAAVAIESVRRLAEWCRITGIEVLSVFDPAGKAQLARVTREIAASAVEEKARTGAVNWKDAVTPSSLSVRLEDPSRHAGWPCPDLLLIHTPATSRKAQLSPLEFEGFPPWQIHLTEIAYMPPRRPQTDVLRSFWPIPKDFAGAIPETSFRKALDEYNGAEMRFGK